VTNKQYCQSCICWFFIWYRLMMHGKSNIKKHAIRLANLIPRWGLVGLTQMWEWEF